MTRMHPFALEIPMLRSSALVAGLAQGKPVYTCSGDKNAGETTGDNFKDSWHVIK